MKIIKDIILVFLHLFLWAIQLIGGALVCTSIFLQEILGITHKKEMK